ncbi:ribbon-helix-helix domain-containing protein [Acetobacter estunensis]|uniref:ribbon-helix-helix domain-containing protein n=1 Tax=Acetobacter estunensis TaxID=104097 RepID=UPI001C2D02B1|nr:ribbon-helix-helix domain-containing protein [Acetobacter estunensis]MBV1837245.1 ribbon-helix-helix domain-containing protein [Acetobacter estunensis]
MIRHLLKRSLVLSGHGTSVALEPEFWDALDRMAAKRGISVAHLVEDIDRKRGASRPLASALRVAALLDANQERNELGQPKVPESPDFPG